MVLVLLGRFATMERRFSKELPYLVMQTSFFTAFNHAVFFLFSSRFLQFAATVRNLSYMNAVVYVSE